MPYITDQQSNTGSYVQSTSIWDVARLHDVDVFSPEFKELLVRLYQQTNNISLALNTKDSAYYLTEEFQPGQVWFNPNDPNPLNLRPSFRTVVDIGTLGAGLTSIAHGIATTNSTSFTKIQGAASRPSGNIFVPLPHANGGANDIIVTVDNTNVNITNNSGTTFTFAYIILEYLKN